MEHSYYLWSGRLSGWLTRSGTYSSEMKDAETFGQTAALERCKLHYDPKVGLNLLPVRVDDVSFAREE